MNYKKIGLVYRGQARYPTVDINKKEIILYFSKVKHNKSKIYKIELCQKNPKIIKKNISGPLFDLGKSGSFDQDGHAARCIVSCNEKKLMYLIGWNKKTSPPYQLSIGVAECGENGWIKKESPVMDRCFDEPYFCTSPCVVYDNNCKIFKMWYCSCTGWIKRRDPVYLIRYAESLDGFYWKRFSEPCINYSKEMGAIGWPMVWQQEDKYKMIFSYRSAKDYRKNPKKSYCLGYAESACGKKWNIMNECLQGLEKSPHGWDSEMVCYTAMCGKYLFYNGNGFGKTGIGLAEVVG
jgi:hypothetical protein